MLNLNVSGNKADEFTAYKVALDEAAIVAITDQKGRITHANDNFCAISKYTREELIGQDHRIINSGYHDKAFIRNLWHTIANGNVWKGEICNKAKDGSIYWVATTIVPFLDEKGKPYQYLAIRADVTQRKQAENQLKTSLKKTQDYQYALDESSIVAITDQKGIINHVNNNFCAISKYTREELIGQDHRIINSGYHDKSFIRNLWNTISNGKIWKGELCNKAKDGSIYWVATTIVPFLDTNGKPYQYLAIRSDITEQKTAGQKLIKANRLYVFLSSINHSILHITNIQELLDEACTIATVIGTFKMAWAGLLNPEGKLNIVAASGFEEGIKELDRFSGKDFSSGILRLSQPGKVLFSGEYLCCNNVLENRELLPWREDYIRLGVASSISLPIKKSGKVVGVFHVISDQVEYFDHEEITLLVESVSDISFALENYDHNEKHKADEIERERLHELHRLLADNTTDLVALHDANGIFLYVSPSHKDILGYEPQVLIGCDPYTLMHPDDIPLGRDDNHTGTMPAKVTEALELRLRHIDGHYVWLESKWTPIFDESGTKVVKIQSTSRDITERKLAEERLRKSEAFISSVLNSLSAHIAVADSSGAILSVNEAWRQYGRENGVIGLDRTCEGSNYFEVCRKAIANGDRTAATALKGMMDVLKGRRPTFYMEYPCHSPTEKQWFGLRVMRFEKDDSLIVIAHENITNLKKAQQERDRTLFELEERVISRTAELNTRNENITDSINYAKRIQVALLPRQSILEELFPNSFIISEPQHIVSGDFFWCHMSRSRKIIAVADCTGHGVPGALMSIIGNNILQHIVVEERIENPSEILEVLDKRLLQALRRNTDDLQDGMDICLCIVDTHFGEIFFAGAQRPLFITDRKGRVKELRGSRASIGGDADGRIKRFDTHRHSLFPGQRIYLSSDGYYSQFGGEHGKKFLKTRFRQTLERMQGLSMQQQGIALLQVFKDWAGSNEQVDDVMVVGIEL